MSSLITRISSNLQLKDDYISSIIRRSNYYYKDYYIPKSNGGRRKISQASPELKTLQYWVKTNILSLLPISKAAFAYNRGNSIKKHATFHKESYFIFHTDIKDFFPIITSEHLVAELAANRGIIEAANLWDDDILDVVSSILNETRFSNIFIEKRVSSRLESLERSGLFLFAAFLYLLQNSQNSKLIFLCKVVI